MRAGQQVKLGFIQTDGKSADVVDAIVLHIDEVKDGEPILTLAYFDAKRPGSGVLDQVNFKTGVKHRGHEHVQQGKESVAWEYADHSEYVGDVYYAATVVHEANRILCAALGDFSQQTADKAPWWQIQSAANGVRAILNNPGLTPEQSHQGWLDEKAADGWTYGPVKDAEKKEHPSFRPYEELPWQDRLKDHLFGIVARGVVGLQQPLLAVAKPAPAEESEPKPLGGPAPTRNEVFVRVHGAIAVRKLPITGIDGANLADFIDALNDVALLYARVYTESQTAAATQALADPANQDILQNPPTPQAPSQIALAGTTYVGDSGNVVGVSDGEKIVDTKACGDGSSATGAAPLPDLSPAQQDAQTLTDEEAGNVVYGIEQPEGEAKDSEPADAGTGAIDDSPATTEIQQS